MTAKMISFNFTNSIIPSYHNAIRPIPCVSKDALIPITLKARAIVVNVRTST